MPQPAYQAPCLTGSAASANFCLTERFRPSGQSVDFVDRQLLATDDLKVKRSAFGDLLTTA
jgi:hypothetical protein